MSERPGGPAQAQAHQAQPHQDQAHQAADLLIAGGAVLPMDDRRRVLEPGWVAIVAGRIAAVGGPNEPEPAAKTRIDASGGVVLPGFISAHQHSMDLLLRGAPRAGPTFLDWLLGVYYAGVSAMTPEDAGLAATVAVAEAQRAGITTICDNWGVDNGSQPARVAACAEAALHAYRSAGQRVVFARMVADVLPSSWTAALGHARAVDPGTLIATADDALAATEALMARHNRSADGLITVCPAPELPEMATPALLEGTVELAERFDVPVCTHLCASPQSAAAVPLDQLDRHRLLSPRLLGAHVRCVSPEDITLLARRGVSVAHCPSATLAMAGPPAPVRAFLAAGIPVGLGVDNPSLNPRADLLGEARLAVLLARLREEDTLAISDEQALEMATIGAARSLGLDRQVGSLEAGKRADLVVLDATDTKWWPRHSWPSAIVHSAGPADVRLVLVEGRPVVEKGRLTWADPEIEQALGPKAQAASIALLERATLV